MNHDMPHLLLVDFERALPFTGGTVADADFLARVLIEWAKYSPTFFAVEFDVLELWENAAAPGDDARDTNQVI